MLKVKVITIGRLKESWLTEALAEYHKRLRGKMEIEWVLAKTDRELEEKALSESLLIALDVKGKLFSSEELSRKMFMEWGSRFAFAIGGAEGLSETVLQRAFSRWSLSPLTFPHQIVRLLLVEQLYRAFEIEEGSAYHK